jgi:glycosyltransferase involved in cell wall biosynthesis
LPPSASIIVPCYNGAAHLRACLDALLSQDPIDGGYDVTVVDNNSTDGSAAIAREYARVRVTAEPTQGAYAARNRGVRESSGRILAFTDPDCVPAPSWLRRLTGALESSAASIALGLRRPAGSSRLLSRLADYENAKDAFVFGSNQKAAYYGFTNNMAVRRVAFDRHGPFVERPRGSDTIFVRCVVDAESCDAVIFVPGAVVRHLELSSCWTYCRKMFTYGRSRRLYQHLVKTAPLSFEQRMALVRAAAARHDYSAVEWAGLASALALGGAAWTLGSWAGAVKSARSPN